MRTCVKFVKRKFTIFNSHLIISQRQQRNREKTTHSHKTGTLILSSHFFNGLFNCEFVDIFSDQQNTADVYIWLNSIFITSRIGIVRIKLIIHLFTDIAHLPVDISFDMLFAFASQFGSISFN